MPFGSIVLACLSLLLVHCGNGDAQNCACTITVGSTTKNLACGETTCINNSRFGCAEDEVQQVGSCVAVDASMSCLASQAACIPGTNTCCAGKTDAGVTTPTCDPTSHLCCVASGSPCTSASDCCGGRACVAGTSGLVCAS